MKWEDWNLLRWDSGVRGGFVLIVVLFVTTLVSLWLVGLFMEAVL